MKHQTIALIVMILAILIGLFGCTPRVCVTPNPSPHANGIRYYRPKPYLKVVPAQVQVDRYESQIAPGMVTITLEYLPDFSEEYAIEVRSGLGIADVAIELEDGWNLTSISQDLDSQTDEQIAAVGDLVDALAGVLPTAKQASSEAIKFTVAASDVPLGYYESVIGRGGDGKKRLYGFRYVGFLPYAACPIEMGGLQSGCCGDPAHPLYGLTFHNGQMVFRPLEAMAFPAANQSPSSTETPRIEPPVDGAAAATRTPATSNAATQSDELPQSEFVQAAPLPMLDTSSPTASAGTSLDRRRREALAANLEIQLLRELSEMAPAVQRVHLRWDVSAAAPSLVVTLMAEGEPVDSQVVDRAMQRLAESSRGRFLYRVVTQ